MRYRPYDACQLVRSNIFVSLTTKQHAFVAYAHVRNIGNVYHALIHAYIADLRDAPSPYQYVGPVGQEAGISVGIA